MNSFDSLKTKVVIAMIAARHGVTPDEVIEEAQAWIDEAWAFEGPMFGDTLAKMFPDGKPTLEELIYTVDKRGSSLGEEYSKILFENVLFDEFDEFADEIDE